MPVGSNASSRAPSVAAASRVQSGATSRAISVASGYPTQATQDVAETPYAIGDVTELVTDEGTHAVRTATLRVPDVNHGKPFSIEFLEPVGRGAFGVVYRARSPVWAGDLAVKVASTKRSRLEAEIHAMALTRARAPSHLRNFVARFDFGALTADGTTAVIGMELYLPVTLHDYLTHNRVGGTGSLLAVAHQLLSAVAAVHEAGCVHRDIKMQNFVFTRSGDLRLIDFGLAATTLTPAPGDTVAGTVSYMAPEMAHNALNPTNRVSVGAAADTWSLGITLFSVLTRRTPYPIERPAPGKTDPDPDSTTRRLLERVEMGSWRWPPEHTRAPGASRLYELVESMLQVNAHRRPRVASVLRQYDGVLSRRVMTTPVSLSTFLSGHAPSGFSGWQITHEGVARTAVEAPAVAVVLAAPAAASEGPMPKGILKQPGAEARPQPSTSPARKDQVVVAVKGAEQLVSAEGGSPVPDFAVTESMVAAVGDDSPLLGRAIDAAALHVCSITQATSSAGALPTALPPPPPPQPVGAAKDLGAELAEMEGSGSVELASIGLRSSRSRAKSSFAGTSAVRGPSKSITVRRDASSSKGPGKNRAESQPLARAASKKPALPAAPAAPTATALPKARMGKSLTTTTRGKPAPAPGPTPADFAALGKTERKSRTATQALLLLQVRQVHTYVREFVELEDIERFNLAWLEEHGRKYAKHPHTFKEMRTWPRSHESGFSCDTCCWDFLPNAKADKAALNKANPPLFWHCSCGMDLCPGCAETFFANRRCDGCDRSFKTLTLRAKHRCAMTVVVSEPPPPAPKALGMTGRGRPSVPLPPARDAASATKRSRSAVGGDLPKSRSRAQPSAEPARTAAPAKGPKPGKQPSVAARADPVPRRSREDIAADDFEGPSIFPDADVDPNADPDVFSDDRGRSSTPLQPYRGSGGEPASGSQSGDVAAVPSASWDPFSSARWRHGRSSTYVEPKRPTAEELDWLTDDGWVKWLRNISEASETLPEGIAYAVQPGRTGCVWASCEYQAHSAVYSPREQRILIVDHIGLREGLDQTRQLHTSPSDIDLDVRWFKRGIAAIATEVAAAVKAKRSPGVKSVFAGRPDIAVRQQCTEEDAFVYVRIVRFDPRAQLTLLHLSNGRVQVLGRSFDLRWVDDRRIFIVSAAGECQLVDMDAFEHRTSLQKLMSGDAAMAEAYLSPD